MDIELLWNTAPSQRRKRDTDKIKVHEEGDLEFYIGFDLDGVNRYQNLSQSLPEFAELDVYVNPKISKFPDGPFNFRPFWPFHEKFVVVMVSTFLVCDKWDYYFLNTK